jgi:hypothetical protein
MVLYVEAVRTLAPEATAVDPVAAVVFEAAFAAATAAEAEVDLAALGSRTGEAMERAKSARETFANENCMMIEFVWLVLETVGFER